MTASQNKVVACWQASSRSDQGTVSIGDTRWGERHSSPGLCPVDGRSLRDDNLYPGAPANHPNLMVGHDAEENLAICKSPKAAERARTLLQRRVRAEVGKAHGAVTHTA